MTPTYSSLIKVGTLLGALVLVGVGCAKPVPSPRALRSPLKAQPTAQAPVGPPEAVPQPPKELGEPSLLPISGEATVNMTAAGFSPAEQTVTTGTTVTFKNEDTAPHWVASDPHPLHTGLPGFDAGAAIAPKSAYQFIFMAPGTYGFHDHPNPSVRGRIVVR